MSYLKGILSAFAALTIILFGPAVVMAIRYRERATGLAVILPSKELLSPVFWLAFLAMFGLFWMAGRLGNKILRVLVFWIPTTSISAVGCIVVTFIIYVLHLRRA